MPAKETVATRTVLAAKLRQAGALCESFGMGAPKGWPDRYIQSKKWTGWIECKAENGKLRKEQIERIKELEQYGANVLIARYLGNGQWRFENVLGCCLIQTVKKCPPKQLLDYIVNASNADHWRKLGNSSH